MATGRGTSKITDAGIEEREALAQKRKGCIGATKCTDVVPPSHCWTRMMPLPIKVGNGASMGSNTPRFRAGSAKVKVNGDCAI